MYEVSRLTIRYLTFSVSQTSGQEGIVNVAHVKILSAEEAESVCSKVDALVKSLNDVKEAKDDNKQTCLTD